MLKHRLKRHRSAKSLLREHLVDWFDEGAEEDEIRIPPHPTSQEDGEFTYKEMLESIRVQGMWAFVRIPDRKKDEAVIHWWAHKDTHDEDVAEMLGHELGHISGKILADEEDEENRADLFGAVSRRVVELLRRSGRKLG